ncbi:uncharacterized protein LOC112466836 [Temnothorax curvispinosus]|uniref:Uncharacterized protein LOC112466836 n=1 Tax=Temnothorax curvispinosus TaxID=300111 RepID=A0A6J1R9N1_9HYME|nr:uncharacterized protein LOC112466836 [Temnothorax curvispinosus]
MEPMEFIAVQNNDICSDNLDNLRAENNCLPFDPFEMEERKQELTDALRYCVDLLKAARVISDLRNSHGTISRRSQCIGKKIYRKIMIMLYSMADEENEKNEVAKYKEEPLFYSLRDSRDLNSEKKEKTDSTVEKAFGNVHSAQIIFEGNSQQSSVGKSSEEISLSSFSEPLPSTSFHASSSSTSPSKSDLPFQFSQHSSIDVNNEENSIETEDLKVSLGVDVEDFLHERVAQFETEFEKTEKTSELEDEIKDLIEAEAAEAILLKKSNKNIAQQLQTQRAVSQVKTEDPQSKNPLFILLRKNGLLCRELIDKPHRNDFVPEGRDINLIAKVIAKHLLKLAIPPKRKVLSSTLARWAQYFKRLFPKTPLSCFYAFKYEPYKRNGVLIQKRRAEGALQVQLFQERRKLIKEDPTVLLRRPSGDYVGGDGGSSPSNVTIIRSTWRPVGQQGEKVQRCGEISTTECHPELQRHLHILCNQLHKTFTPELGVSWKATFNYRRKLLVNQTGTVWDYLNDFPFLKINDIGKDFICKDFDQLYPTAELGKLAAFLDDHRLAIIKATKVILKRASRQKHIDIATLFLKLAERESDFQVRVTGALLLLPFIFPNTFFVEKTWKPTRLDVMDSFIARVCSEADIKDYIERRRKSLSQIKTSNKISYCSVQPYVLAIGPTWERISHVHIIVDQVLYTCQTIIGATELCFKLFHAFHTDYPAESKHVWQLIQQGFYKLFVKDHDLHRPTITKTLADIGIESNTEEIKTLIVRSKRGRKV